MNTYQSNVLDCITKQLEITMHEFENQDICDSHTVTCLIDNPSLIHWRKFIKNPDDLAVDYMIKLQSDKIPIVNSPLKYSLIYADQHPDIAGWDFFSLNSNDKAVQYNLDNPAYINWELFCLNTSDKSVQYLIDNSDKIDLGQFSLNPNDIAVQYLIDNPDMMDLANFSYNTNDKSVKYLIDNPDKINRFMFSYNRNPIAINYHKYKPTI